jgi:hypothetical protein
MALHTVHANSTRCVAIALWLIALSVALQGLSALAWADPERTRAVLEFLYVGRGAVLQGLHVMALALLTIALVPSERRRNVLICIAWAAAACCGEFLQHPSVVSRLLSWSESSAQSSALADAAVEVLVNARFAWSEMAASIAGSTAAWRVVR